MTTQLTLTLGEILKIMRERAGLTQRQLGDMLEISRNTVNRYESGATPRWRDVVAWALECEHSPDIARDAWEAARESGCIYEALSLFEVPDVGDVAFRDDRGRYRTPLLSHPPEQFGQGEAA
jgi:transcriptional regulator with XRE-family HTH domain